MFGIGTSSVKTIIALKVSRTIRKEFCNQAVIVGEARQSKAVISVSQLNVMFGHGDSVP